MTEALNNAKLNLVKAQERTKTKVGRTQLEMGGDSTSWCLADQSDSIGSGVLDREPQSKRRNLSGLADAIGSAIQLHGLVRRRKHWTTQSSTYSRHSEQG